MLAPATRGGHHQPGVLAVGVPPKGHGAVHPRAGPTVASRTTGKPLSRGCPSPLAPMNAEVDRRVKVVGIFPNSPALPCLATAVLQERQDEWQDGRCHVSLPSLARLAFSSSPLLTNPLTPGRAA